MFSYGIATRSTGDVEEIDVRVERAPMGGERRREHRVGVLDAVDRAERSAVVRRRPEVRVACALAMPAAADAASAIFSTRSAIAVHADTQLAKSPFVIALTVERISPTSPHPQWTFPNRPSMSKLNPSSAKNL